MCNRYHRGSVAGSLQLFDARQPVPFNVAPEIVHPGGHGLIVRQAGSERLLEQLTWGFPFVSADMLQRASKTGSRPKPKPVNNARFDGLRGGMWGRWSRDIRYRCLIPVQRFAEAVGERGRMTTTWLSVAGQPIFAWAGLWRPADDAHDWGASFSGVMTDNSPLFAHVHHRLPVILKPDEWELWLTASLDDVARLERPFTDLTEDATDVLWSAPS